MVVLLVGGSALYGQHAEQVPASDEQAAADFEARKFLVDDLQDENTIHALEKMNSGSIVVQELEVAAGAIWVGIKGASLSDLEVITYLEEQLKSRTGKDIAVRSIQESTSTYKE